MIENKAFYLIALVGLSVLIWTAYSALKIADSKNQDFSNQYDAECGDINDPKNIQHLSHHPDTYRECIRQIDPQKFKDAVGEDIGNYLG